MTLAATVRARLEAGDPPDRVTAALEGEAAAILGSRAPAWMHEALSKAVRAAVAAAAPSPSTVLAPRRAAVARRLPVDDQSSTAGPADAVLSPRDRLLLAAEFAGETKLLERRMSSGVALGEARLNDVVSEYNAIDDLQRKAAGYRHLLAFVAKQLTEVDGRRNELRVRDVLSEKQLATVGRQIGDRLRGAA